MTKNIKVAGDTSTEKVEVKRRRYNTKGPTVETISMTIPKTLNQTINGIVVRDSKSRSRVITELIEKGLSK